MNFEYKETIDKQRELVSLQKKVVSKSLVSALKSISLHYVPCHCYRRFFRTWCYTRHY